MGRTREAALSGAVRAIAKYGSRKATMGDIAMLAGIAKATLYNHFRTRDDLYGAVVRAEVDAVAASAAAASAEGRDGFAAVLTEAVKAIAEHPALRRIARDEPAVGAALATVGDGPAWASARAHIAAALRSAGLSDAPAPVEVVLRYLASHLLAPATDAERVAAAQLLSQALAGPGAEPAVQPARLVPATPPAPDLPDTADTNT